MMKKLIGVSCLLLLSAKILATTPTVEGLLRNPANPEVAGDTVVVDVAIEEKAVGEESKGTQYFKIFANQERHARVDFLQVQYKDSNFNEQEGIRVKHVVNFAEVMASEDKVERNAFFSLFLMTMKNDWNVPLKFLRRIDSSIKTDEELINREKYEQLLKQKQYLRAIKDNPALKGTLENPNRPKDEALALKTKEILAGGFLHKGNPVALARVEC